MVRAMGPQQIIALILDALQLVIVADALLSWLMSADKFPRSFTTQITDPLYAPIRALISPDKTGGMDLSPILMLFLIHFMKSMLAGH